MYNNKYLKYKNKYNNLKNQLLGGVHTLTKDKAIISQFEHVLNSGFITDEVTITEFTNLDEYDDNIIRTYIINDCSSNIINKMNDSNIIFKHLKINPKYDSSPCSIFNNNSDISLNDNKINGIIKLNFGYNFNDPINKNFPNLEEIEFNYRFDQSIDNINAPKLKSLVFFNGSFNQPINKEFKNLEEIIFGDQFNKSIDHFKAPKLESLIFTGRFDKTINNDFPELTKLIFGENFNRSIDNLNLPKLKILVFGPDFDQPINISLPKLNYLWFGYSFNQSIDNIKAPELQNLLFGSMFNQSINNFKAPQLRSLSFGTNFNSSLNITLPELTELTVGHNFEDPDEKFRFLKASKLVGYRYDTMPDHLFIINRDN